jgi:hypothetical protein
MLTEQLLDLLDADWRSKDVELVTFPAPPTPAKSVLYAEDSWRSNAVERGMSVMQDYHVHANVLAGQFTDRGPAFLMRRRLSDLFDSRETGQVVAPSPIYCATISYTTLMESGGLLYATDTVLEGVSSISRSCHPASHTVVPNAPYLTAFLELRYAKDGRLAPTDFTFADHIHGMQYFPNYDFQGNAQVDWLFRYLTLADCLVSTSTEFKLFPVVSKRLRQLVNESLIANSNLAVKYNDNEQYIEAVDAYNQLMKEHHG